MNVDSFSLAFSNVHEYLIFIGEGFIFQTMNAYTTFKLKKTKVKFQKIRVKVFGVCILKEIIFFLLSLLTKKEVESVANF